MARIMVVEDDVYMREELTDLLRKSGYETASLFDFENAIPEITEYSPDLVLLDINLPFHSGFEICKELKAKQLGTVLVLTARDKGFTGDTGSYLSRSTGMGLYLVQKMATDLSITVELKNNSCGGTTVTLTFPKVERPFGR